VRWLAGRQLIAWACPQCCHLLRAHARSGGKDSCYSMMLCRRHGHEVVALANLCPAAGAPDELDSFMFQTVGHQLVAAFAACAELPLFRRRIGGASRHTARAQRCRHPSMAARAGVICGGQALLCF